MKISYVVLLSLAFISSNAFSIDDVEVNHFNITINKPHEVILLNHGLSALEARLQLIEKATKTIDVEYFIYRTDKSAKLFTQALVKKAREGVKVRMLLDYFMIKGDITAYYAHELEAAGVQIKYFNKKATINLFSGQYRNHRKVLLVDGYEDHGQALTGGRNIGDEYFDLHKEYNFLDRDIVVKGEIVKSIQETFDETFHAKKSIRLKNPRKPDQSDIQYETSEGENDTDAYERDLKRWQRNVTRAREFINSPLEVSLTDEIRAKGTSELALEHRNTCQEMSFISEYPTIGKRNRRNNRMLKHDIFQRIEDSKKSIMFDSPYFIVNNELGVALNQAFENKVDVRLLTNSLNSTDAIYVYAAFDSIALKWLTRGLDSYIFKGERPKSYEVLENISGKARFGVHAKTFIFDQEDVIIGTYNVDPRSANYNSEMYVVCENNPEFAAVVQKDIDSRLNESIRLDSPQAIKEAEFYQTGFGKKLVYYFLKIPARLFRYLL